ncbi:hypothetical protein [Azospirillum palustre]
MPKAVPSSGEGTRDHPRGDLCPRSRRVATGHFVSARRAAAGTGNGEAKGTPFAQGPSPSDSGNLYGPACVQSGITAPPQRRPPP